MEWHRWARVAGLLALLPAGTARAETAVVLEPVVVSPAGAGARSGQASASLSVIDGDTLLRRRFHNLGDGLKEVEGVDVSRGGKAGGANIRIRGMPADYTLILIDGKRLNQSASVRPNGFGDVDSHFIPPASAIERIEVMRGAMAVQYGADALGGVVNIITRK
ncbi:MAG: TonB-dependent receptor plug domain-containing protein, partial [Microvirgula sp.]